MPVSSVDIKAGSSKLEGSSGTLKTEGSSYAALMATIAATPGYSMLVFLFLFGYFAKLGLEKIHDTAT